MGSWMSFSLSLCSHLSTLTGCKLLPTDCPGCWSPEECYCFGIMEDTIMLSFVLRKGVVYLKIFMSEEMVPELISLQKGKSAVCSARLDYTKSKIWLIIACKWTGKSKCRCTECGFKENSRNHRPGLHRVEISIHCILRTELCVMLKYEPRAWYCSKTSLPEMSRRASAALLVCCQCSQDILRTRMWLERVSHPLGFQNLKCMFGFVSSNHVPLNCMTLN